MVSYFLTGKDVDPWFKGIQETSVPLTTQFNEELPYDTIDMDFMNENQSAHGDREYGHIVSRMGIEREIIVGHWAKKKYRKESVHG